MRVHLMKGSRWLWGMIALLCLALSACGANLTQGSADQARATLETALSRAIVRGVEPSRLESLYSAEHIVDQQRGLFGLSDDEAAQRYQALFDTEGKIESEAIAETQSRASSDLALLASTIDRGQSSGFVTDLFPEHLKTLRHQFAAALTPNDYMRADKAINSDLATLRAMEPAYDDLTQFRQTIDRMSNAGLPTALQEVELTQVNSLYINGNSSLDYYHISHMLDTATVGLVNDQAQAIPYLGGTLLDTLQQRVDLAQHYGENVTTIQSVITQNRQLLGKNDFSLSQYLSLQDQVTQQTSQLDLLLSRGQTHQDIQDFQALTAQAESQGIDNYEYTSEFGLIGFQSDFAVAKTDADYQSLDNRVNSLTENLKAMIRNASNTMPHDQAHQTDRDLIKYYGITSGKVIVVSLREQTARMYDNGTIAMWTYITTGRPERPSPPGLWQVLDRQTDIVFQSGDTPDSAFYYKPTPVSFALLYHEGGFYLHDAWWRVQFGPGSNLPHYDPNAFDGGSHGCINVPLQQMSLLYDWTPLGTPVIVY